MIRRTDKQTSYGTPLEVNMIEKINPDSCEDDKCKDMTFNTRVYRPWVTYEWLALYITLKLFHVLNEAKMLRRVTFDIIQPFIHQMTLSIETSTLILAFLVEIPETSLCEDESLKAYNNHNSSKSLIPCKIIDQRCMTCKMTERRVCGWNEECKMRKLDKSKGVGQIWGITVAPVQSSLTRRVRWASLPFVTRG